MDRLPYAIAAACGVVTLVIATISWLRTKYLRQKLRETEDQLMSLKDEHRRPIPEAVVARIIDHLWAIKRRCFYLEQIAKPQGGEEFLDTMVESVLRVFCSLGILEYDATTRMGLLTEEAAAYLRGLIQEVKEATKTVHSMR